MLTTRSTSALFSGFRERRAMTHWSSSIASLYAAMAEGISDPEESSWTACRARCRAFDNVCREDWRGGCAEGFWEVMYAGGGWRVYGGGGEDMVTGRGYTKWRRMLRTIRI